MKMARTKTTTYEVEIPEDLEGFKNWEFSTGTTTREDFKVFSRVFKKFVKNNIPNNAELVEFSSEHYFLSGFIKQREKFVYFSISDVRHFKNQWAENILIRTAKNEKDFTGGSNGYTDLENFKVDIKELLA